MSEDKLTTKELVKELEELGFKTQSMPSFIYILFKGIVVASIVETEPFCISTDTINWLVLNDDLKEKAFDLLVRYAKTPLEDREEPKKYYLRHNYLNAYTGDNYLNWDRTLLIANSISLDDEVEDEDFQTQFTKREIKTLEEDYGVNLDEFEEEEVDE